MIIQPWQSLGDRWAFGPCTWQLNARNKFSEPCCSQQRLAGWLGDSAPPRTATAARRAIPPDTASNGTGINNNLSKPARLPLTSTLGDAYESTCSATTATWEHFSCLACWTAGRMPML